MKTRIKIVLTNKGIPLYKPQYNIWFIGWKYFFIHSHGLLPKAEAISFDHINLAYDYLDRLYLQARRAKRILPPTEFEVKSKIINY